MDTCEFITSPHDQNFYNIASRCKLKCFELPIDLVPFGKKGDVMSLCFSHLKLYLTELEAIKLETPP